MRVLIGAALVALCTGSCTKPYVAPPLGPSALGGGVSPTPTPTPTPTQTTTLSVSLSIGRETPAVGDLISFVASIGVPLSTVAWNFGNGATASTTTGETTYAYPAAGTFDAKVIVTAKDGRTGSDHASLTVHAKPAPPPSCPLITVTPSTWPNGTVGIAYDQSSGASGGTAPVTFAIASGTLPPGLLLNASSGRLSGTPTTAGTFTFDRRATDALGCAGTTPPETIVIAAAAAPLCSTITVTPSTWPNGIVGILYDQSSGASGGTAPVTFTIASGTLPAGLTLSLAGRLAGTPTTDGTSTFARRGTDVRGCTNTPTDETITIAPAPLILLIVDLTCSPQSPPTLTPCNVTVRYDGAILPSASVTNVNWDFGDGATGSTTGPVTSHLYLGAGSYTVFATATATTPSAGPKTATANKTITISP